MKLLSFSVTLLLLLSVSACNRSYSIYLLSKDVGGIYEGSDIVTRGLKIGEVGRMSFYDKDYILVQLKVDKRFQLPRNSKFTFVPSDLLGSKNVEVTLAPDSITFYRHKDTVYETLSLIYPD